MTCSHCCDLIVEDRFLDWTVRWRCLKHGHLQDTNSVQRFLGCHEFFSHGGETKYPDEEVDLST
jgi:hypothetical protein